MYPFHRPHATFTSSPFATPERKQPRALQTQPKIGPEVLKFIAASLQPTVDEKAWFYLRGCALPRGRCSFSLIGTSAQLDSQGRQRRSGFQTGTAYAPRISEQRQIGQYLWRTVQKLSVRTLPCFVQGRGLGKYTVGSNPSDSGAMVST